jgi:hypothetical protein
MGTALPREQGYGVILALFLLLYLAGTLVRLVIISFRFEKEHFQWRVLWNYGPSLYRRENIQLKTPLKSPLGTRYRFTIKGTLQSGNRPIYSLWKEKVFSGDCTYELPLPLPGLFSCRGRLYISDLFGFFHFPLRAEEGREILYHPPLLRDSSFPIPLSAEENEENVKNDPSNPEKVLMREYQPGDLVRDINWKASGKFSGIYTRISPDKEQAVSRMTLLIRADGTDAIKEPAASALLLGLKSLASTVFHTLRKDECQLEIMMGEKTFDSRADNFEEQFTASLCTLGGKIQTSQTEIPVGALILTTVADRDLPLLTEKGNNSILISRCSSEGEGDLLFSLFYGNSFPRGDLFKALLTPGTLKGKLERSLKGVSTLPATVDTGVIL